MDSNLLKKLFGTGTWNRDCVVLVDADAAVKSLGQDSIATGGAKTYAPRVSSGRINADVACYHAEHNVLLVVQRVRAKAPTGEDILQQTLTVIDAGHVVGVEFAGIGHLAKLGLTAPPMPEKENYTSNMLVG
jgi:hypothetical protein